MDEKTRQLIQEFVDFVIKEISTKDGFKSVQVGKWAHHDYKISLEVFLNTKKEKVYFDLREVKDNQNHFLHLLENLMDQIAEKFSIER